jgi:hypothetical protein
MQELLEAMTMNSWNDDRLDELSTRVDNGFARVDREMKEGFARVDARIDESIGEVKAEIQNLNHSVDQRFDRLDGKFDRLAHALMVAGLTFGITVFAAVAAGIITPLAT